MIFPQKTALHLWFTRLDEDLYQAFNLDLLDQEELKRAKRFKFDLHRKRFITAHAALRSILSLYLKISPENIHILKAADGKPYLKERELQFNLSHSHHLALYAITLHSPVGIDIEKIRSSYPEAVAKRFFSPQEYEALSKLPEEQKRNQFFKLWTGKEALIKALGTGLRFPLSSFSLPLSEENQTIDLENNVSPQTWYLKNIDFFQGYSASCVSAQPQALLSCYEWALGGQKEWTEEALRGLALP